MKCPACGFDPIPDKAIINFAKESTPYKRGERMHIYCDACQNATWIDKDNHVEIEPAFASKNTK